jgi:hypothetical protein
MERVLKDERASMTRITKETAGYIDAEEPSMKSNGIGEPIFRDYCITRVFREGQVEKKRLLMAGGERSGHNWRKTCVYWLDNLTSDEGVLGEVVVDGTVYVVPR